MSASTTILRLLQYAIHPSDKVLGGVSRAHKRHMERGVFGAGIGLLLVLHLDAAVASLIMALLVAGILVSAVPILRSLSAHFRSKAQRAIGAARQIAVLERVITRLLRAARAAHAWFITTLGSQAETRPVHIRQRVVAHVCITPRILPIPAIARA